MVSVIIPDTALTEMTVSEAAATDHSQILSFIYQSRSNKELWSCIELFSSFPPDWKEESKWPFLVARQQKELSMPKKVPCFLRPSKQAEILFFRTEQRHQQHHHDDVVHVPPLVQIQQDAEDHDLYELQRRPRDTWHVSFLKVKSNSTFIQPLIDIRNRARGLKRTAGWKR